MLNAQLMPPMHADTIRACGVGFRAHKFLHSHMGARPVVVVETHEPVACKCCGGTVGAGERVLRFDYGDDVASTASTFLHSVHCMRGTTPIEARAIAAFQPRITQPVAA